MIPHLKRLFHDYPTQYDCAPLQHKDVLAAEKRLGIKIPVDYLRVLRVKNGGLTTYSDVVSADGLGSLPSLFGFMGLGGDYGIDAMNDYLKSQWDLPNAAVVFAFAGHAGYMLDYSRVRHSEQPRVIHVDSEQYPDVEVTVIAETFLRFLTQLRVP